MEYKRTKTGFRLTKPGKSGYTEEKAKKMVRAVVEYAEKNNLILILERKEK
jgi:hypothetical protein